MLFSTLGKGFLKEGVCRLFSLLLAGWNGGVMAGAPAAMFNHEEEAEDGRSMRQREPRAAGQ